MDFEVPDTSLLLPTTNMVLDNASVFSLNNEIVFINPYNSQKLSWLSRKNVELRIGRTLKGHVFAWIYVSLSDIDSHIHSKIDFPKKHSHQMVRVGIAFGYLHPGEEKIREIIKKLSEITVKSLSDILKQPVAQNIKPLIDTAPAYFCGEDFRFF